MRVWIDLANSPHVPLMSPVVRRLRGGGHEVLLTVRDHAQTLELAGSLWPNVIVVGGQSPPGRLGKGVTIARRAEQLRRFVGREWPDVAFSHGSYAQLMAARASRTPGVTMMDYEHQPANHLSFRLATQVIVPAFFPDRALRRYGAAPEKVVHYEGFKEELYLAGFQPDSHVLENLGIDASRVIAVFRPPPSGALYHRMANQRFDDVLRLAIARRDVQVVMLPRTQEQRRQYELFEHIYIPTKAVDGSSLLALADLMVGAGGTMNRESAILGIPTYTVFAGRLAAVDAELVKAGRMNDLREAGSVLRFEKKRKTQAPNAVHAESILSTVVGTLTSAAR
jgi:predicted glycosyltransferase